MKNRLAIFESKEIRKVWNNEEWWFSVEDIIFALTDNKDPKQYIKKLRKRDLNLELNWGIICTLLEMVARDLKKRKINCSNTEWIFRLIQSIPSKKAERFKLWLAKVGYERVKEIENPELSMDRMKELYEKKWYSKDWIDKRTRSIAVRQDSTDEWKNRWIKKWREYWILTAEISKAAFGMTPSEYRDYKGLKRENLRDHMTDLELIFSMLWEASTTNIMKNKLKQLVYFFCF